MPAAIKPPKPPASVVEEKKNENLFWASLLLYQQEIK